MLIARSSFAILLARPRLAPGAPHPASGFPNRLARPLVLAFSLALLIFVLNFILGGRPPPWRVSVVTALSGLWISSALFGYLAVQLVAAIDWLLRAPRLLAARFRPRPKPARRKYRAKRSAALLGSAFQSRRRRFVQTVSAVAGAIPFAGRRLRLCFRAPALPDTPRGLAGERICRRLWKVCASRN